jgi:hypothetical protein
MNLRISIILVGLIACTPDKSRDATNEEPRDTITDKKLNVDERKNHRPEKVIEDIRVDNNLFTEIILTSDNATFNKIIIKKGDKIVFELYDQDSYDTIESGAIKIKNEIKSKNLLLQKIKDRYFISLFGAQYGCCVRELTIVQVDKNGATKIFKDDFEVHEVSYSDNGEIKYFGIESFSESVGVVDSLDIQLFTYNPTQVYSLSDSFKFDSLATKKYNEENYVFAGHNYQGELRVAFPKDWRERKKGTRKPYIYRD